MFVFFTCNCGNCRLRRFPSKHQRMLLLLSELEGFPDSKKSDLVLEDIGADAILKCVTGYPGITPLDAFRNGVLRDHLLRKN